MAAAKLVFLRRGYRGSSVDEIAAETGVSKQTIYNHFGDNDRLLLGVVHAAQDDAGVERYGVEVGRV
jgi:TetR/AcrR family transcriptional repressor of mexJK operon